MPTLGIHTLTGVNTSDGESRRPWWSWVTGRGPFSRRRSYVLAALWLFLVALAVGQFVLAKDSTGRWLAGLQCLCWLSLAIAYVAAARANGGQHER